MVRDGFGDCGSRPYVRTVVVPARTQRLKREKDC